MNFTNRLKAALSHNEPGEADPQARDQRPSIFGTGEDVSRETPDRGSIDDWTSEYEENPLVRKPSQKFTADVLEPGLSIHVDTDGDGDEDDDEIPTVAGYHDDDYNGLKLDDALEKWLAQAGIVDGEFGHDTIDVLDKIVKDLIGRRGTGLVEVVYDDATEKQTIMGLRPFKVETVTAYTHVGKNILLRPDDSPSEVDVENGRGSAATAESLPQTDAGDTAAYVQFDDIFNSDEDGQVELAQDDVVKLTNDADTGDVFGLPDSASVYDRAKGVRQQYKDLDQAIKAVGYSHWIAKVDTDDEDQASNLLGSFDPGDPERINVVNYGVETEQFDGSVPDVDSTLQQEIEYVLSAFPVPLYRVGFAGDINRDISGDQSDDYTRELSDARNDIASQFDDVIQRKASEFVDDAPDSELRIEPDDETNPLKDEEFDAEEFKQVMTGVKAVSPGGTGEMVLPPKTVLETFLGLDADDVLDTDPENDTSLTPREAFEAADGADSGADGFQPDDSPQDSPTNESDSNPDSAPANGDGSREGDNDNDNDNDGDDDGGAGGGASQ